MCRVIAVSNQKGGVGKTVSCVNLGIGLAQEGKKVLLIDADPQGSLTISLGYEEPDEMEYSLATLMMNIVNDEKLNIEKTILHHKEGVDLIPANIELSAIEVSLVNAMSRELILRSMVDRLREFYDYIIIDCMPSLGMMTINALACADSVLIPVQAAYLPVKGLQQLIKTIGRVKKQLNPKLKIEGILLTMVARSPLRPLRKFWRRSRNWISLQTSRPVTLKQAWQTAASSTSRMRSTPPSWNRSRASRFCLVKGSTRTWLSCTAR